MTEIDSADLERELNMDKVVGDEYHVYESFRTQSGIHDLHPHFRTIANRMPTMAGEA